MSINSVRGVKDDALDGILLVNDFGCYYHEGSYGDNVRCSCNIFRVMPDESMPHHPRVFRLPMRESETEKEATNRYRGLKS